MKHYGWSKESVPKINGLLEKSGFNLVNQGMKCLWNPDEESKRNCFEFGREISRG